MVTDTRQTLLEAWRTAREAAEKARQLMREAEVHHKKMMDLERLAWLALKDHDWAMRHHKTSVTASAEPVEESNNEKENKL